MMLILVLDNKLVLNLPSLINLDVSIAYEIDYEYNNLTHEMFDSTQV